MRLSTVVGTGGWASSCTGRGSSWVSTVWPISNSLVSVEQLVSYTKSVSAASNPPCASCGFSPELLDIVEDLKFGFSK